MATEAQINANRANAQKSTGPKTPEGKAKSCLNHVSHGFTSATVFVTLEDQEEFKALYADLNAEFQPATPHEQILLGKMVHNQWNSLRAIRLQSITLMASVPNGYIHQDLSVLLRYQTTADRAYRQAHADLLTAQKERKKSEIGFDSQNAAEAPKDTQAMPEFSFPDPPPMPDRESLARSVLSVMGEPVEEYVRQQLAELRARRKAA